MTGVVLRVVCDRCGNVVVGTAERGERYFFYEPRWRPDTSYTRRSAGTVNYSERWWLTGPGPKYAVTVDCRRHGLLTFDADKAVEAAQSGTPWSPATIRAYPA